MVVLCFSSAGVGCCRRQRHVVPQGCLVLIQVTTLGWFATLPHLIVAAMLHTWVPALPCRTLLYVVPVDRTPAGPLQGCGVCVLMCWQVEQYKYTTVADFVADVEQLVANARAYNKLGSGGEVATPAVIDIAEGLMAECQGWVQDPAWAAKAAELEAAIWVGVQAGAKGGGA